MKKKNNCWLCERGTGLDNGALAPGELRINFFGDLECIYCTARLQFTVALLEKPELIPLLSEIQKLPTVEDVIEDATLRRHRSPFASDEEISL